MTPISVILATRNRPALFAEALASVAAQTSPATEIIVVDDGSAEIHRPAYQTIVAATERVRFFSLIPRPRGHGQSYALNFGAAQATGDYLCFLDDDDCWTDAGHLARVRSVVAGSAEPVDLHMSNQIAMLRGQIRPGPIWIEDLAPLLRAAGREPDAAGAYAVSVEDALRSTGFCHLNTLVVRRALYEQIGGMDENIRWECDRDLYLRLIDRARLMKHSPETVARHNIPDPDAKDSMTTSISDLERRLFQMRTLDRAALLASHPAIRAHGRQHKAYALKKIAEALAHDGRNVSAAFYAREALGAGPTFKWTAYAALRMLKGWAKRD
jgi:glycosyltransferase involved in cell wall biosynthesis